MSLLLPPKSARLHFRPYTLADLPRVFELHSDPAVMRFIKPVETLEESQEKLAQMIEVYAEHPGEGYFAAVHIPSGAVVGWFMIRKTSYDDRLEVGYRLAQNFWDQGLATEGTGSLVRHGFEHLQQNSLMAMVRPEHAASRRVLEKAGFQLTGTISAYGIDNLCRYQLDRSDWATGLSG